MSKGLTSLGLAALATSGRDDFGYIAVGTGSQAFSVSLVSMASELVRASVGASSVSGSVLTLEALFPNSVGNDTLIEWGIFDAAAGGNLLAYGDFSVAAIKTSQKGLLVAIPVTVSNA